MASPNPVPSRAAINALRGVILTTSCSVILLAEERRRRINIARAAIDNARKLHTVRVNHGPALSEAFARREAWPVELGDELPSMNLSRQSNGPPRRKRRSEQARAPTRASELKEPSRPSQTNLDKRKTRQEEWAEWDEMRREISRISTSTYTHNELLSRMLADEGTSIPPLTSQELESTGYSGHSSVTKVETRERESQEAIGLRELETSNTSNGREHVSPRDRERQEALRSAFRLEEQQAASMEAKSPANPRHDKKATPTLTDESTSDGLVEDTFMHEDVNPNTLLAPGPIAPVEPLLAAVKDAPASMIGHFKSIQPQADKGVSDGEKDQVPAQALDSLDEILIILSSSATRGNAAEQLDGAIPLFQQLVSTQILEPKVAVSRGCALLRAAAELHQYDKIPGILETTLPACTHVLQLIAPFMDFVQERGDTEAVRQLLTHSSHIETRRLVNPPTALRGSWVNELLKYRWRSLKDLDAVNSLYQLLQRGGLFTVSHLPKTAQYAIRRRMALIALNAGDDAMLHAEIRHLRSLRPQDFSTDMGLNGKLIVHHARLGRWDTIYTDLSTLKDIQGPDNPYYQNTLAKATDLYAKKHSPEDVDVFVRELVDVFGMTLNQSLAFLVMDRHGRNRDIAALVQWFQFCQDEGLELNQAFFDKVAYKCCKYWNFLEPDVQSLFKGLRTFIPWLEEPRLQNYTQNGALNTLHKGGVRKGNAQEGARLPVLSKSSGLSRKELEQDAFKCMNSRALRGNWDQVSETYIEASARGLKFSPRCLRLAVVAKINKEGGCPQSASNLVREAHADGHDVSAALVPLLVAQLETGSNPEVLINETLRQGFRIHDSVYNKAVRTLIKEGRDEAAVKMCKLAARENGGGEPAYNEYNFSSLLLCCAKLSWYTDLRSLVSSYTTKMLYWHGSNECRQSIKFAMKRVALKAETNPAERHDHEDALICIDQALQHLKECRSTIKADRQDLKQQILGAFEPLQPSEVLDNSESTDNQQVPVPGVKANASTQEAASAPLQVEYSADQARRQRSHSHSSIENSVVHPEVSEREEFKIERADQWNLHIAVAS